MYLRFFCAFAITYIRNINKNMETKTLHPIWALACKHKGTELRLLNGRYYLYEVTSKWNPEKKRLVKGLIFFAHLKNEVYPQTSNTIAAYSATVS